VAEALKTFFDARLVRELARELRDAYRPLDEKAFVRDAVRGLSALELTARGVHVADVMRRHLPDDVPRALDVIVSALGPKLTSTEGNGMTPFRYMPHAALVARHGIAHFAPSMRALEEITKRFTGEFAIRPFIERYPDEAMAQLELWTRDDDVHVRRLVSEGTRPRLPWGQRLRAFMRDPTPVLALLERLKDDDERYVQRSVANNLNDIAKDHPALVVDVCRRWMRDAPPGRVWIVHHALRGLVKAGDSAALDVIGFGHTPLIEITRARAAPLRVRIGGTTTLTFDVVSHARDAQTLLVDIAVFFRKQNGRASPKVFKLGKHALAPGEQKSLRARIAFADLSTRTNHPGTHHVEARVNGAAFPLVVLDVRR
jgi:3-methyladenine DNA glycosylase AlkC